MAEKGENSFGGILPRLREGIDGLLDAGIEALSSRNGAGGESRQSDAGTSKEDSVIVRQRKVLQTLAEPPLVFGTILQSPVIGDVMSRVVVALQEGRRVIVPISKELYVSPGDWVSLSSKTLHVVDRLDDAPCGTVARVKALYEHTVEVEMNGGSRTVLAGKYKGMCTEGDRVVLDPASAIVVCNLGNAASQYAFTEQTHVTWDDICGVEEAKAALKEMLELPYQHRDVFDHYRQGNYRASGALLLGPSGCGKTLCMKAAATSIASVHGDKGKDTAFISISGSEILSRFVGEIEATVRAMFRLARQHYQLHGYPAVIAIDEAESILKKRGSGRSSDVETTVVPMFLAEMNGLRESGAIVLLATNRPEVIDSAVLRDKRIDRKIKVTRPTEESATLILQKTLKDIPIFGGTSRDDLIALVVTEVFSDKYRFHALKPRHAPTAQKDDDVVFLTLAHLLNGAMVEGIATKAIMRAINRDIQAQSVSGVSREDVLGAIDTVFQDNRHVNHDEEIQELAEKRCPGLSIEVLPPEQFQTR